MVSTTHLKTAFASDSLHIAHIYDHISAWEHTPDNLKYFQERLQECLVEAKDTGKSVMFDHDGLMHLVITPGGYIKVCCPIATYQMVGAE